MSAGTEIDSEEELWEWFEKHARKQVYDNGEEQIPMYPEEPDKLYMIIYIGHHEQPGRIYAGDSYRLWEKLREHWRKEMAGKFEDAL